MNKNTIATLTALALLLSLQSARAGSATWNLNPTNGDWNTAANWIPATVPNGPSDTASFGVSATRSISVSAGSEVSSIIFDSSASAYTITMGTSEINLNVSGAGIINNSGAVQSFVLPTSATGYGFIQFFNSATAGSGTAFTMQGASLQSVGGFLSFYDTSSAGDASFTLEGAAGDYMTVGGHIIFYDNSTAANGTFLCKGGNRTIYTPAYLLFYNNSSAANANILVTGSTDSQGTGGQVAFGEDSKAENATLTAIGTERGMAAGTIVFYTGATGGNARVRVFGTGVFSISGLLSPSLTIGSLEGNGNVSLGSVNLFVGRNNLDTTFSGGISGSGSLVKIGEGKMVLASPQARFHGNTHVQRGTLLVNNRSGSATGTGDVFAEEGVLGGSGIIAGSVAIGTGGPQRAALRPGQAGATSAVLSILGFFLLNRDSTLQFVLNSDRGTAGGVVANGVTASNALISVSDAGDAALPAGTVFTVINNTSATPITGTFSNLADGATIAVGNNTFLANYEGGDGNDLTLTVQ